MASLVDIRLGNAVAEPLTDATVTFVYLLPKGNAKVSRKLMRELKPGTLVITYVFRLPAEHWDAHLERVEAIKSTRDRASGGVDASAYNKISAASQGCPSSNPRGAGKIPETETTEVTGTRAVRARRRADAGKIHRASCDDTPLFAFDRARRLFVVFVVAARDSSCLWDALANSTPLPMESLSSPIMPSSAFFS